MPSEARVKLQAVEKKDEAAPLLTRPGLMLQTHKVKV